MSHPVITTPEVDAQVRAIDGWWRANRLAAPNLFIEELANCFAALEQLPKIGQPYRSHTTIRGLRRLLLRATRYHVYYVAQAEAVAILAVWHSQRGQLPRL